MPSHYQIALFVEIFIRLKRFRANGQNNNTMLQFPLSGPGRYSSCKITYKTRYMADFCIQQYLDSLMTLNTFFEVCKKGPSILTFPCLFDIFCMSPKFFFLFHNKGLEPLVSQVQRSDHAGCAPADNQRFMSVP